MNFHLHTPAYTYTHFQREQEPKTRRRRPQKRNCARKPSSCPTLSLPPFTSLSRVVTRFLRFSLASLSLYRSLRLSACECVCVSLCLSLLLSLSLARVLSLPSLICLSLCVSLSMHCSEKVYSGIQQTKSQQK